MKTSTKLRRTAHPAGAWTSLRLVAFAGVAVFAGGLGLFVGDSLHAPQRQVAFLQHALGPARHDASLERRPAAGTVVRLAPGGYRVRRDGLSVGLHAAGGGTSPLQRHTSGTSRRTPYGWETTTVTPERTEQFLTVVRPQGPKTWRWRLETLDLSPRVGADGAVGFLADGRLDTRLALEPVRILDGDANDVTPEGLRWAVERSGGSWWLELELDDRELPSPYVIDPAITYRAPATVTGTSTSVVIPKPAGTAANDLLLAQVAIESGSSVTITAPSGWTLVRRTDSGSDVGQGIYRKVAGGSEPASYTFTLSQSKKFAAGMLAYYGVHTPSPLAGTSTGATGNGATPTASSMTTTYADSRVVAFFTNKKNSTYTPPAGMSERYDAPNAAGGLPSLMTADATQAAVGATGAKAATSSDPEIWVAQLLAIRVDATAPSTGTISIAESNAATYATGTTLYYRPTGAGGTFTVTSTATDGESGVQTVTFPGLSGGFTPATPFADTASPYQQTYTWTTGSTASGTQTLTATDNAGNTANGTFTLTSDSTGPTGGALTANGVAATGGGSQSYDADGAFTLTRTDYNADAGSGFVSSTLTRENGTLSGDACSSYGAPTTLTGAPSQSGLATGCYRFTLTGTDRVGNTSVLVTVVKVDTSAPAAPTLTLSDSSTDVHATGTTAYYRPAGSGSFSVTAASTDADSGVLDYGFPALAGFSSSGTGDSRTYTLATPTEPDGAKPVTARNLALLTSSATNFTLTSDSGAPSGGALTVNGTVASVGGTASYDTDGAFAIGLRTDWADAGSGLASSTLTRENGTLSGDACSSYASPTTLTGAPSQSGLTTGCYRFTLAGTDNVGNTVSITTVVKVDTSDPSAPTLSLGDTSADVHTTGTTVFYRPAGSGSFDVTAASADAHSGIASYSFPSLAGFTISGSGDTRTYTLASPTEADGAKTVSAQNGAGRTSSSTFTLTADSAAPAGGSVTANGGGAYDTDGTVALAKVDFSDGGAGIGTQTFVRESATLAGDACGSFSGSTPVTISGGNDADTLATGCYRYTLAATDRVGNTASAQSTVVKVDTSAPSAPSLAFANLTGDTFYSGSGTVVWFRPLGSGQFDLTASASDPHTGVASYAFPALGSGWTPSGAGATRTYAFSSGAAEPGARTVTTTNGAGTQSAASTFTISADGTNPTGGALTVNGTAGSGGGTTSHDTDGNFAIDVRTDWTDAGSGLASSTLVRESGTLAVGACGAFGSPSTLAGSPAQSGLGDGCYRYTLTGTDRLGNTTSVSTVVRVDSAAPTSALDAAPAYSGTAINLTYAASDGGSGLTEVELWAKGPSDGAYALVATDSTPASPSFSYTAAQGDGTYLFYTRARDAAGSTEAAPGAADTQTVVDTAKPSSSTNALPAFSTDPAITITYASSDATSGVDEVELWARGPSDGAYALVDSDTTPASASFSYTATQGDGLYRFYTVAHDIAGNVEDAPGSADAQTTLDIERPTDPVLSFGSFTNAAATGTTVYIREGVAGAFTVTSDSASSSGIDHHTFPVLGGSWTGGGSVAGDPASAPYTFTAADTAPAGPHVVTATNGAGATNTGTSSFSVVADTTAPTSSIACDGAACSAGWYTSAPVSVTLGAVDGGSGVGQIRYTTDGSDPSPINGTVYLSAIDVSATTTFRYRAYDAVGNEEPVRSTTVQVDASAPTAPSLTIDETDADTHKVGTTLYYNPSGGRSGTFTVTATSSDAQSAIAKLAFPSLTGATGGGDDTTSPYVGSYSWDATTTAAGAQTVTSYNGAGLTSTATFTTTADTTAPTASISCNGAACSGGWYTTSPVSVTLAANDAGAGLREIRYTTDGSDPLTGTVYAGAFNVASTATVRYTAIDEVGNAAAPSSTPLQIDTTAPSATMTDPGANLRGTVALASSSADAESGVATTTYQRSPAGAGTWTNTAASWATTAVADGLYDLRVVVVNGAGLSSTSAVITNRRVDNTLPTATMNNPGNGNHSGTISLTATATDGGSGVANVTIQRSPAGAGTWTTVGTDATSPYAVSWDTTAVPDGRYDVRAISTDNAGNQRTSNVVANVKVANNPPIVTITSPQDYVNATAPGTYTITADGWGAGGSGPRQIEFFRCSDASASCSGGTWISLAVDTTEPYSATWTQSSEPEGNRALKATITDQNFIEASDVNNVTIDRIAPSGQSAAPTAGPWFTATSVGLTLNDGSDGGSGLDATSRVLERQSATLTDGSCGAYGGWTTVSNPDASAASGNCYRYRLTISDLAGNPASPSAPSAAAKVDTSAPTAPSLAFAALTNASATGSTVYFRSGAAGGFTVTGTAADPQSGVASYSYPTLGSGWSESGGAYTFTGTAVDPSEPSNVTATNAAGLASPPSSFTVTPDALAPVSSISCTGGCGGWHSTAPVTVTLSASDGGSGVVQILYSTDGSAPSTVYAGPFTISAEGTTSVRFSATDAVGNAETPQAQTVRIDTTAPTAPTLSFSALSNAVAAGATVFYNPALAGGFTVTPSSTDALSGIASYSFPALGTGWSETAGAYSFAPGAADPTEPNDVRATNGSGLTSAATPFTVTPDAAAPATTAACNGAACSAGWYTTSPVSVSLSASDAGSGVDQIRYTTDGSDPTIVSGSAYLAAFDVSSQGTTTIKFRAFDAVGNAEPVQTLLVRIDSDTPETTIDTGPSGSLSSTGASFAFSSDEPAATFECRLDGGAFTPCTTPKAYTGLADGSHTFEVRAVDGAGAPDPTPASRTWTVDTIAADTTITASPPAATTATAASFSFIASDAGPTFECRLDAGAYAPCTSPKAYVGLVDASHTFSVRAVDAAGNTDASPAVHTWTVDTAAPDTSITLSPADPSANTTPTFGFASTESPATYEVNLDGAGWVAAATPLTISPALADGSHTLQVRASDAAGNQDASAGSHTWTVDATSPTGSLTMPADGAAVSGPGVFLAANSADVLTGVLHALFERAPAGTGSWTTVGSPDTNAPYGVAWDTTGLADGDYDLRVTTRDLAGNQFVSPIRTVTVDNTVPTLSVSAPNPVNLGTADPASVTATASDDGTGVASVTFEQCSETSSACLSDTWTALSVDTAAPYTVAWSIPSDGTRLLRVTAADEAGRQAAELVLVTVDRTRPSGSVTTPAAGANLRGSSVALAAGASDAAPGAVDTVTFQRSQAGAGAWTNIGLDATAPYGASWDTTGLPDGLYDLRVFTTDAAGNAEATPTSIQVRVDNTAPTGAVTAPTAGANLRDTVLLTSNSADTGSGVESIRFQHSPAGEGTWTNQAASWDTTLVSDGEYDVRVVTTDEAGNAFTSPAVTVRVDNTAPIGTVAEPDDGADVRGTITLTSDSADAGSGVATVQFQRAPAGSGSWTVQAANWNTTLVVDGLYDVRVITTDNAGNAFTSALVTVRVDNTLPTGAITAPTNGAELGVAPVALTSNSADAGSGVDTIVFERRHAGTSDPWTPTSTPWNTVSGPDATTDGPYELRVTTTDRAGNSFSSGAITLLVDHTAPSTSASLAPGSPSNAPVTVSFSASDGSGSGVSVTSYRVDGGSLQQGSAVVIAAPGDHSNDGSHVVEFFSTDDVGNVEAPSSETVVIDTTAPSGTAGDPGSYLRGIAQLGYATSDTDVASVQFQHAVAGSGTWVPVGGADVSPPYEVTWNTVAVADGAYDIRAVVTDSTGNVQAALLPGLPKYVDNTAPTGSLTSPAAAALVAGSVAVNASAGDGAAPPASGVNAVRFEVKPAGSSSFTIFGTETTPVVGSTYQRALATTDHPDGPAELRVVVTDRAGNETTSAARTITIDNVAPTVTLNDPGAAFSGTPTLAATAAADTVSVTFEYRPAAAGAWTAIGTDSTPGDGFAVTFATGPLTDGLYELRARALDAGGNSGTSGTRSTRIDNELPNGSITSPGSNDKVGGSSVGIAATASDSGSGVASVEFTVKPNGASSYSTITTDSTAPFVASWDATGVADGLAQLRLVITDAAGNQRQSAVVPITVDATGPSVTLNDPGAVLAGRASLTTTTGGGATRVVFGIAPAGTGSWTQVAEATTAPFDATLDAATFADGLYDVRAIGYDAFGNASVPAVRSGVRFDNTAPRLVSSTPQDGSVSTSVNEIALTASEPVVATGATLDGAPAPAPAISGSTLTFATGSLADGLHVLSGRLEDASGTSTPFRVAVTIESTPAADRPPVERSGSATAETVLTSAGALATAAVGPAAWPAGPSLEDFVVIRVDPTLPLPSSAARLASGTSVIEVTARWALAGTPVTQFQAPIEITIPNPSGTPAIPAVSANATSWRPLRLLDGHSLPAGQQDGFYRDADGVHVLTRHLTYFALLGDVEPPTPPRNIAGVVFEGDGLTLRWMPGTDDSGELGNVILYVNGESYGLFDPTQFEAKLGAFTPQDTRAFTFVQVDAAGNRSDHSPTLRGVPAIVGVGLDQARTMLAARGFGVGALVYDLKSDKAPGTVLGYEGNALQAEGTKLPLRIAGKAPEAKLAFDVAVAKRLVVGGPQILGARLKTTRAVSVTAMLRSPRGRLLHTWRYSLRAGVTIVDLQLPVRLQKAGVHRLVWVVRDDTTTTRRSVAIHFMRPFSTRPALKRLQVLVASPRPLPGALPAQVRVLARTDSEETYSLSSSRRHDVRVVVVDVDAFGIRFFRDLRRVFPYMRLVAVSADPGTLRRAKQAGASVTLRRARASRSLAYAILGR